MAASVSVEKAFHALSDPLRIKIIESLRYNEHCVQALCEQLEVSQSKLSFHLRVLKESAIIRSRSHGRFTYYSLNLPQIATLEQHLADLRRHTLATVAPLDSDGIN